MKSLGQYLQSERLARGLKLEEISKDTKISLKMLRAIEDGNIEQLPAPVLVKGFLRAYAQKVGLDPELLILRYQDLSEEEGARLEALEKFHQRLRPESPRKKLLIPLCISALVACLVLVVWLSSQTRRHSTPPPSEKLTGLSTLPPAAPPAVPVAKLPEKESSSPPTRQTPIQPVTDAREEPGEAVLAPPTPPASVAVPDLSRGEEPSPAGDMQRAASLSPLTYELRAEVLETTWLYVAIDESQELEYLLHPGEQLRWRAGSKFKLHIGNAAGLRLHLNGQPLKPLGESGQVVHLQLPDPSLMLATESSTPNQ